jgi:hypothetical protein
MTTTATAAEFKPIHEFDEVPEWPRGDRLAAIRDAAADFKRRFKAGGQIRAARSVDVAAAVYPVRFAFHGAAKSLNPYGWLVNRMVVVQYEDFEGRLRTLVWEPTVPEGSREAPFYAQSIERFGEFLSTRVLSQIYHEVPEALALCGLRPEDVDYMSFDHLHVQDPRMILGTTQPVDGQPEPYPPLMPNATMITQRREAATLHSTHPMQWAWYVEGGLEHAREDNHMLIDGDVELGRGVAIVRTPGHTDGNHSLVLSTPDGVWVSSENGVASDNWQPELSKIPGVRKEAEFFRREVIMNANTLEDSIDQYDSMVKEKCLADPSRRDPRWLQILPSSELASWKRQWPIVPTHRHGGIEYGRIERPSG